MCGRSRLHTQAQVAHHISCGNAHLPRSDGDISQPKLSTCIMLLRSCIQAKTLIFGHIVHDFIIKCGHYHVSPVSTLSLQLYLSCGALRDALQWFVHMPVQDVCSWNLIIGAFAQQGDYSEALEHYQRMKQDGIPADQVTYVNTLSACTSVEEGFMLYADIRGSGFDSDTIVGTALVSMFGRLHSVEDADLVFDRITVRNIISWNAMISAYSQNGQGWKVSYLFNQTKQEGLLPDKVTLLNMLTACAGRQECQGECKRLHLLAMCGGFVADYVVRTALIHAYGMCGFINYAILLFQEMQGRGVVSWNAMIKLYAQEGPASNAVASFNQMQVEGIFLDNVTFVTLLDVCARQKDLEYGKKIHLIVRHCDLATDVILMTALINMYGKCGKLGTAHHLFIDIKNRNIVSWNTLISAYTQHGYGEEAFRLFHQMQHEAMAPNKLTLVELFSACACLAALTIGKKIHSCVLQSSFAIDDEVGSSLINMYAKCGNAKDAQVVFNKLHTRKRSTWNALIASHAQLGDAKEAIQLFQEMELENVPADDITFVSILAACSRGGMLDEGCHYFVCMRKVHSLTHTAEHYDSTIDLLCRAGLFDHASYLIRVMPIEPTIVSWTSLLCAFGVGFEG